MAKAQARDEHPGFADLTRLDLDPLDRIAGVIDLDALAGREYSRAVMASGERRSPSRTSRMVSGDRQLHCGIPPKNTTHLT
jgi:hypothetical protein